MKRSTRQELAKQTVEIVEGGAYETATGRIVNISHQVSECLAGTRLYSPQELDQLKEEMRGPSKPAKATLIEVVNETTLSGLTRLLSDSRATVGVLNFASAKNPGGGFLNGSQAQEESLARSSALHASLMRAWDFYEQHRQSQSLLYSDAMIFSPGCPVFRNDEGVLLDEPLTASFITSAAPNAGAAATNRPDELPQIPAVFRRRSEGILALAAAHGIDRLVLGAWGCGVFRNDPSVVANAFAEHLVNGGWSDRFNRVVFSVLDTSPGQETFAAFQRAFCIT
jgi:uncharacterized protein (TIGR02452 family)